MTNFVRLHEPPRARRQLVVSGAAVSVAHHFRLAERLKASRTSANCSMPMASVIAVQARAAGAVLHIRACGSTSFCNIPAALASARTKPSGRLAPQREGRRLGSCNEQGIVLPFQKARVLAA